jgi:hypothetical protein
MAGEICAVFFRHILDRLETALSDVRRVVNHTAPHSSNVGRPAGVRTRWRQRFLVGR